MVTQHHTQGILAPVSHEPVWGSSGQRLGPEGVRALVK